MSPLEVLDFAELEHRVLATLDKKSAFARKMSLGEAYGMGASKLRLVYHGMQSGRTPANHGQPWTAELDDALRQWCRHEGLEALARRFSRTTSSISMRMERLGLAALDADPAEQYAAYWNAAGMRDEPHTAEMIAATEPDAYRGITAVEHECLDLIRAADPANHTDAAAGLRPLSTPAPAKRVPPPIPARALGDHRRGYGIHW